MTDPIKSVSSSSEGLILTRQWLEKPNGTALIFWLATEDGPMRVAYEQQESVCFFPSSQLPLVKRTLAGKVRWRVGETKLKSFQSEPVSALYLQSQRQLFDVRDKLAAKGLHLLESDIKPTDRYLMERFVTGAAKVIGNIESHEGFKSADAPAMKPGEFRPQLRAVSLDIETDYDAEYLYSIGLYADDYATVLMVNDAVKERQETEKEKLVYFPDEASLLLSLIHI